HNYFSKKQIKEKIQKNTDGSFENSLLYNIVGTLLTFHCAYWMKKFFFYFLGPSTGDLFPKYSPFLAILTTLGLSFPIQPMVSKALKNTHEAKVYCVFDQVVANIAVTKGIIFTEMKELIISLLIVLSLQQHHTSFSPLFVTRRLDK
ncbi:hypothetical protein ACJX0J_008012, partial [Zea mays]